MAGGSAHDDWTSGFSEEEILRKKLECLRQQEENERTCWIVAGPNGAGKSTLARRWLPAVPYLNADNVARENGLDASTSAGLIAAGRIFHHQLEQVMRERRSFALVC